MQDHYDRLKEFSAKTLFRVNEEEEMSKMLHDLGDGLRQTREFYDFHKARVMQLIEDNDFDPDDMLEILRNADEFMPDGEELTRELRPILGLLEKLSKIRDMFENMDDDDDEHTCSCCEEDVNWLDKLLQLVDTDFGIYLEAGPTLPFLPSMFQSRGIAFMPIDKIKALTPHSKKELVVSALNKFAKRMKELQTTLDINLEDIMGGNSEEEIEQDLKKKFDKFCKKFKKTYGYPLKDSLKNYLAELRGS